MPDTEHLLSGQSPSAVLDVPFRADAATVRAAYLAKVRQFPPDRCPAEFERIRDAYETLCDPRRRVQAMIAEADPTAPLSDLLTDEKEGPARRFVGWDAWLAELRRLAPGGRGERR